MYLAWFDADRKKPVTEKIAEARERYLAKFGAEPAVCLVNPADAVPGTPVELRPAAYISRNCFWIGVDEQAPPRQPNSRSGRTLRRRVGPGDPRSRHSRSAS